MSAAVAHAAPGAAAARPRAAAAAAAGARPRAGGGMRVRVPLRLVVGAQYGDAALSTYIKIAALSMRREGCTAAVETIADYLGVSKSVIERALKQLSRPDTEDGITEVLTTRRTLPGGRGQTAHRTVRVADEDELYVWIPARAATALPARLLRLYALITYAQTRRIPLSLTDLGEVLRHQGGKAAGLPLGDRQVSRLIDDLAATGWATVREREGLQGRHAYEAHLRPLQLVPASPDIHDGSGPDKIDGSLSEEDPRTDRLLKSAPGDLGIRRRRPSLVARGPVDNSVPGTFRPSRGQGASGACSGSPADGSGPTLSARAWSVLEPVRHLLGPDTRGFVVARIEREIARQLAAGTGARRITDRLQRRYACTEQVKDGGRWILGAGLPRHGCGLDVCEDGVIWHTGQACGVCADLALDPAPAEEQPVDEPPPPPVPVLPPGPLPPVFTAEQLAVLRAAAGPDTIRAAVAQYGRTQAIYLYGWRAVAPALTALDGTEGDSSAH